MLVLIDCHIPYIKGVLEPVAEVRYLEPLAFTPESVREADALVVRTRTRCDAALLQGSHVRFISTATIGYDHIDTAYCRQARISWANAPGCNADAVCQYVEAALQAWAERRHTPLRGLTLGIIGVGHVGSRVARMAAAKGMNLLLNDPPLQAAGGSGFASLTDLIRQADILTVHTPLTAAAPHPTLHLLGEEQLQAARARLLINAARGGIVDEAALLRRMDDAERPGLDYVADCWEREPHINPTLVSRALIATPHIAGYSRQGKANATTMAVQALSRHFHLGLDHWQAPAQPVGQPYDILADDRQLRSAPDRFEQLRGDYKLR